MTLQLDRKRSTPGTKWMLEAICEMHHRAAPGVPSTLRDELLAATKLTLEELDTLVFDEGPVGESAPGKGDGHPEPRVIYQFCGALGLPYRNALIAYGHAAPKEVSPETIAAAKRAVEADSAAAQAALQRPITDRMMGSMLAPMRLEPGDVLVVYVKEQLPRTVRDVIKEQVQAFVPGVRCLVMENGATLGVLRPGPEGKGGTVLEAVAENIACLGIRRARHLLAKSGDDLKGAPLLTSAVEDLLVASKLAHAAITNGERMERKADACADEVAAGILSIRQDPKLKGMIMGDDDGAARFIAETSSRRTTAFQPDGPPPPMPHPGAN